MAGNSDGPGGTAAKKGCPLKCRLRDGAAAGAAPADQGPARDQVDWAGLPVNLDLAFSCQQRDKVYAQHLMRMRGAQLRPWLHRGAQLCVCEIAAEDGDHGPSAA